MSLLYTAGVSADEKLETLPESWRHATGGAITGIARDGEGRLYAVSEDRYLYRFNSEGILVDRITLREKPAGGIVFLPDGSLCVALRRGVAHLDAGGREIWFRRLDAVPVGSPSTDRYGYIYYSIQNGGVESITHTGRLRWRTRLDGTITAGFAFDPSSGRGIAAAGDRVYCLRFTGAELWRTNFPGYSFFSAEPLENGQFALVAPEGIVIIDGEGELVQEISFSTVRDIRGIFSAGKDRFLAYSSSGFLWEFRADHKDNRQSVRYLSREAWYLADARGVAAISIGGKGCVIGTDSWLVHGYEIPFRVANRRIAAGYDLYSDLSEGPEYYYLKALEEAGKRENVVGIMDEIEAGLDEPAGENGPAYMLTLEAIVHGRNSDAPGQTGGYAWDWALRSRAVEILGVIGNLNTIRMIRSRAAGETHPEMMLSSIRSLGNLASDPEGQSIAVIAELSDRNNRLFRDPRIASAAVTALERIGRYQPSNHRSERTQTLLGIFYGSYPGNIRQNAMRVLEMSL